MYLYLSYPSQSSLKPYKAVKFAENAKKVKSDKNYKIVLNDKNAENYGMSDWTSDRILSREFSGDAHSMSSEDLESLPLEPGQNEAAYYIPDLLGKVIYFSIFLIHKDQKLVVTDVDGTITRQVHNFGISVTTKRSSRKT